MTIDLPDLINAHAAVFYTIDEIFEIAMTVVMTILYYQRIFMLRNNDNLYSI
jgi:hypothetical protein